MKKLNKIISIISLISATGLPFAISSCSKEQNVVVMHDLLNEPCTPMQPHSIDYWNQTDATKNYITDVKNNPEIFENDACLSAQKLIQGENYDEFGFGVNKPKFGTTNIWQYGSEDVVYSTITASQKIHTKQSFRANEGEDRETDVIIDLQVWYDNVVFYAFEDAITNKWCLGLFDYSVGEEAYWPFVSNTEPWSLRYSCKVLKSEYYVKDDQRILINNQNSYYTGIVDNGETLINLCKYYQELEAKPAEEKTIEEQRIQLAISIILSDYESNYLSLVMNIPEIRVTGVLKSECDVNNIIDNKLDLLLKGLIFIMPTYFDKSWLTNDTSATNRFIIRIDRNRSKFPHYQHQATEEPALVANEIIVKPEAELQYGGNVGESNFRYYTDIPAYLGAKWWDTYPEVDFPIENILFSASETSPSVVIEMYATDALAEAEGLPWTLDHPLRQNLNLGYDYVLHDIQGGINKN